MIAIIFAGPSISPPSPPIAGIEWRPPVRQGDLFWQPCRAPRSLASPMVIRNRADGLAQGNPLGHGPGIHVYGAASIGEFGPRAHGVRDEGYRHIYRQFRAGQLTDDDEVAVCTAGGDDTCRSPTPWSMCGHYRPRAPAGVVEPAFAARLVSIGKSLFYKDRTYEAILDAVTEQGLAPEALRRFAAWLPSGKVDQKRIDAGGDAPGHCGAYCRRRDPAGGFLRFSHTFAWEEARLRIEMARDPAGACQPVTG